MHEIRLHGQPLDLELTLTCGQAFRWTLRPDGVWAGVVRDRLVELARGDDVLKWRTHPQDDEALVQSYLRLDDDVNAIYSRLAESDPRLAELTQRFRGMRLLRQDPAEALMSFVCSTASNIPRITASVEALAQRYGNLVCESSGCCYYAFPIMERIAGCCDKLLDEGRLLGFRDRVLRSVARQVLDRGAGWLTGLRLMPYERAWRQLVELKGVGRKIADCVCLFALDKDEAVPVDTHVRQIAESHLMPGLTTRTITAAAYERIASEFKGRYDGLAGWAQQFLYYEDLLRTRALGRGRSWSMS